MVPDWSTGKIDSQVDKEVEGYETLREPPAREWTESSGDTMEQKTQSSVNWNACIALLKKEVIRR